MCRWAFFNGRPDLGKKRLRRYFKQLRNSQGGQGDGIAVTRNGKLVNYLRVTSLDTAVDVVTSLADDMQAVWHTRIASVGPVDGSLVHPHHFNGKFGKVLVAHNGTDQSYGAIARYLSKTTHRHWSDTAAYASVLSHSGPITTDHPTTGVWLTWFAPKVDYTPKNGWNPGTWLIRFGTWTDCVYMPELRAWASEPVEKMGRDNYYIPLGNYQTPFDLSRIPERSDRVYTRRVYSGSSDGSEFARDSDCYVGFSRPAAAMHTGSGYYRDGRYTQYVDHGYGRTTPPEKTSTGKVIPDPVESTTIPPVLSTDPATLPFEHDPELWVDDEGTEGIDHDAKIVDMAGIAHDMGRVLTPDELRDVKFNSAFYHV